MPTVSVILPTCDRPQLWPRALRSVLRQTFTDFEVLLVDSNRRTSPLREHPYIAEALTDPRVRLIEPSPPTTSSATARNAGLANARGDWVTFLDDDDEYRPDKIAAQLALAQETGARFVLCGYTVNLPRRRRTRQVDRTEFAGDEILTEPTWGTPMLFCQRDPELRFDETLRAGEDEVFAHAYFRRHNITRVPNCPRSLIDVYPQIGRARVHADREATWEASQLNWRNAAGRFSEAARHEYLVKSRLVHAQNYGSNAHFVGCVGTVLRVRGLKSWRLILNATARRYGLLKNWVVS